MDNKLLAQGFCHAAKGGKPYIIGMVFYPGYSRLSGLKFLRQFFLSHTGLLPRLPKYDTNLELIIAGIKTLRKGRTSFFPLGDIFFQIIHN